jgi:hypothetical protein
MFRETSEAMWSECRVEEMVGRRNDHVVVG